MTTVLDNQIHRLRFNSRHEFAKFASTEEAPRFSAIRSSFYDRRDEYRVLGITPGEAIFSDDRAELYKAAIGWERNGFKVSLVKARLDTPGEMTNRAPEHIWLVTAGPDFPDDILEPVFIYDWPSEYESESTAIEMALEQLCVQDEHPILFIDNQDDIDKQFLAEILAASSEKSIRI